MEINKKNKDYWNLVKGIGILSIVIGHTTDFLEPYVYLYHLVIFFFVSGYLYSEEKYGDQPFLNFLARFRTNWKKYFVFSVIFILLHNIFLKVGMIINTTNYDCMDIVSQFISSTIFLCSEVFAGALWFIPVLIIASSIFGGIVFLGRKLKKIVKKNYIKDLFIIAAAVLFAMIGMNLHVQEIYFIYHIETSILVIPIFIIAYYARKLKNLNPFLKWYVFVPCICFLYLCINYFHLNISLASHDIPGFKFYFISLVGIYACLYFAKILLKLKYLKRYFLLIGKYSFEIMALHFFIIKSLDLVYAVLRHETNPLVYGVFPYAYSKLWLFYIIIGTIAPCVIMEIVKKIGQTIEKKNWLNGLMKYEINYKNLSNTMKRK